MIIFNDSPFLDHRNLNCRIKSAENIFAYQCMMIGFGISMADIAYDGKEKIRDYAVICTRLTFFSRSVLRIFFGVFI